MTQKELDELGDGDIIRHLVSGEAYIVIRHCGYRRNVVAIRTIEVTNPEEWKLVLSHNGKTVS